MPRQARWRAAWCGPQPAAGRAAPYVTAVHRTGAGFAAGCLHKFSLRRLTNDRPRGTGGQLAPSPAAMPFTAIGPAVLNAEESPHGRPDGCHGGWNVRCAKIVRQTGDFLAGPRLFTGAETYFSAVRPRWKQKPGRLRLTAPSAQPNRW